MTKEEIEKEIEALKKVVKQVRREDPVENRRVDEGITGKVKNLPRT